MLRRTAGVAVVLLGVALAGCVGGRVLHPCHEAWPAFVPGESKFTLCQDGNERDVILYVPQGVQQPVPLLLLLHGGGGSGEQVRSSSGMDAVADGLGFAVVYPEGTSGRNLALLRTWNAMACCGRAYDLQVDDVGFLGSLIDGALDHWPIDATRVGVAGHSNGAMMAYRLAAERSDVVASAMPVAGSIGGRVDESAPLRVIATPAQPVSILDIHATDDDHVPYDGGHGSAALDGPRIDLPVNESLSFWTAADGIQGEQQTTAADGTVHLVFGPGERGTVVEHVRTKGGHGWPGSHGGALAAPAVPAASLEIGHFLVDHPRSSA